MLSIFTYMKKKKIFIYINILLMIYDIADSIP